MEYKNKLGKPCTAAQFITDIIIKRRAEKENSTLPFNYYKIEPWSKYYKQAIIKANSLLKMYEAEAIIEALNSKEGKNIFSLNANWLIEIIDKKQKELEKKKVIENLKIEEPTVINQPNKTYVKSNILGKLNGKKQN